MVLVLIGVLAFFVFSAGRKSIEQTREATCAHHLRQVGMLLHAYALDHHRQLPGFGTNNYSSFGPLNHVHKKLVDGGYTPSSGVFFCPADQIRRPLRDKTGWAPNPEQGVNLAQYSGYMHFYHRPGSNLITTLPDNRQRWRLQDRGELIIASDQWSYGPFTAFHSNKGLNVLRLNGSVEWISPERLKSANTNGVNLYYSFEPKPL